MPSASLPRPVWNSAFAAASAALLLTLTAGLLWPSPAPAAEDATVAWQCGPVTHR